MSGDHEVQARKRIALITGITGQDGSYLAELLLSKGYEVHGIIRRASTFNTGRIQHLYEDPKTHREGCEYEDPKTHAKVCEYEDPKAHTEGCEYEDPKTHAKVCEYEHPKAHTEGCEYEDPKAHTEGSMHLHYGDMTDSTCLVKIVSEVQPTEVYNLAAQSHVKVSFELAEYTADVDATGTLRLLDAIRTCGLSHQVRFYQASTSELYGKVQEIPQKETTPFYPRSPYGVAKLYGFWIVINYREAYNMFACNGILFNHESPRRGETFVTRKITRAVAKIHLGQQDELQLGNLDAKRDWGHAKDYVEAMWLMLQQDQPDDYVISTGETHSVREFVEKSFKVVGVDIEWEGERQNEVGKNKATGKVLIRVNPKYYRPTEVDILQGDCSKAKEKLGWQKVYSFDALVKEMVEADLDLMKVNPTA